MNHVTKLLFVTLMLTMVLNSTFGQVTHTIELRLDPNSNTLYDPGTTEVHKGDTVYWKIKRSENIESFNITGAGHPFRTGLPDPDNDYIWIRRVVVRNAPYDWKYNIFYRLNSDHRRQRMDPKIAVKPSGFNLIWLIAISISFVGILSFAYFRRKRSRFSIEKK